MSRSFFLLLLFLLASCAREQPERRVLLDLDCSRQVDDPVYGSLLLSPPGLHRLGKGWAAPGEEAILALGPEAALEASLTGSAHRLRLVCSSHPVLVARGLRARLELNGIELAEFEPRPAWQLDTLVVDLPESLVRTGLNRFVLRTNDWLRPEDGENTPWSLYVRRLSIDGDLLAKDRERWAGWKASPADPADRAITIPGEIDSPAERVVPPSDAADVLLIVLDALRADRVGAWGYPHPTTPVLDSLAVAGVALTRVFAEAPYTRSSVATLLSTWSWRDHGVLGRGDALAPNRTTLAEVFREKGWSTLAISDNSNVARSAGSDQGFGEFVQTWSDLDLPRDPADSWWWPEKPVMAWEQRVDRGLDPTRPLFAYLHLMPPHEPYFPGAEHDLFGAQEGGEPVRGTTPEIERLDQGIWPANGPEAARMSALYDGALHRGDALVRRALAAFRSAGRERPLLVVVVSDHGEGFGEHGRFGHNSTPYDEMLRVPVIFSPAAMVPGSVRESAGVLRSLGDVGPLILSSLGLGFPAGSTWPARAVEVLAHPQSPRAEIFVRCGMPVFARRTANTLTVLDGRRRQEFYDLDRSATENLRWTEESRWREAVAKLRGFVQHPLVPGGAVKAELTPEDRERLRALGYAGGN